MRTIQQVLSVALLVLALPTILAAAEPRPLSQQGTPPQQSESVRTVEEYDSITVGRLKLQFPKHTIKVDGVELIDDDNLFRATFRATSGTAIIYQDQLRTTELLRGTIRSLRAQTYLAIPGQAARTRLRIKPGQFQLEIQALTASIATGVAGNLGVKSRFLLVRNKTELVAVANSLTGRLSMQVTDATLDRIKFNFAGTTDSLTLAATFSLPKQSEWLIDLETSRVLWEYGIISARDVRLDASPASIINMGGVKIEFRKLHLQEIEANKERDKPNVVVNLHAMELDAGSMEITKDVTIKGALKEPLTLEGWWWAALGDDGQLAASYYDFSSVKASLNIAQFKDAKGLTVEETNIALQLTHLCAEEMAGSITVEGGNVALAGSATGRISLKSLSLSVAGPTGKLSGTGRIELNSFRISTEVQTPVVDRCADTMPLRINDAEGQSVQGNVVLKDGKTALDMRMDEFSAKVGLGYYKCEWNQKVGDLGRWEISADVWCPTWSEPFRTCRQTWVIWDGGPVYVHWLLVKQPTVVDTSVAISDLRVKTDPDVDGGKLKLCGGRLKFLSPNAQWFSLSPNVNATGTVADVFRDTIQLFAGAITTNITAPLEGVASAFGSSGIIVFQC